MFKKRKKKGRKKQTQIHTCIRTDIYIHFVCVAQGVKLFVGVAYCLWVWPIGCGCGCDTNFLVGVVSDLNYKVTYLCVQP